MSARIDWIYKHKRKIEHQTRKAAYKHIFRLWMVEKGNPFKMRIYKCNLAPKQKDGKVNEYHWHVGHKPERQKWKNRDLKKFLVYHFRKLFR